MTKRVKRRVVVRCGRSASWHWFHILMCLCTGGLWLPVYAVKYAGTTSRRTIVRYR